MTTVRVPLTTDKDGELFCARRGDWKDQNDFDFKAVYSRAGQRHEDKQSAVGLVYIQRMQNICTKKQHLEALVMLLH